MHVHGFLAYEVTYIGVTFIVPRDISYHGRQLQDCTTTENVEGSEQKVYCKMNVLVYNFSNAHVHRISIGMYCVNWCSSFFGCYTTVLHLGVHMYTGFQ